jgi:hypothetical protein
MSDFKDAFQAIHSARETMTDHEKRIIQLEARTEYMERDVKSVRQEVEYVRKDVAELGRSLHGKLDTVLIEFHNRQGARKLISLIPPAVATIVGLAAICSILYTAFIFIHRLDSTAESPPVFEQQRGSNETDSRPAQP